MVWHGTQFIILFFREIQIFRTTIGSYRHDWNLYRWPIDTTRVKHGPLISYEVMHDSWLDFPPFVCIADAYWSCTRRHDLFRFVTWHHRRNKRVESVMESSKSVQTRNHSNDCKYCAVIRPQNLSLIFLQEQNFQLVILENDVNDDFKNPKWTNICLVRFFIFTSFFPIPWNICSLGSNSFHPIKSPPQKTTNMTMKTSTNWRCLCFLLVQWGSSFMSC